MLRVATDYFHKSDQGVQRRSNEDRDFARPPLFAVADGMGGARAGELASQMVVDLLAGGLPDSGSGEERLAERAQEANRLIHDRAQSDPAAAGMGTTLTAAYVGDHEVSVAHVGDSRAYRLRDGELEQITEDHSLVGELVRRGKLTEAQAEDHPQRSVITRALGPEPVVDVDTWTFPAQPGDVFLLCSDGLTSMVEEGRIAQVLREHSELKRAGQVLIDDANRRGGRDNITVVLFRLEQVDGAPAAEDQPTQVSMPAPSPDQVASARTAASSETAPTGPAITAAPPGPAEPPRRTVPLPDRRAPAEPPRRRKPRRGVRPAVALALIAAIVLASAWIASRAVYFVGTTTEGFVAVYRGLPYDGPVGIDLYERAYVSGLPASEIPPRRRGTILDHRLRTHDDARDLVRQLELGRLDR